MIVWALFDSGNGSYTKVVEKYFKDEIEIYPIGMDIENKNNHFINLDLADYSYLFGNNKMYDTLDKLPKPDLIIASPPCESWSVASAMRGGNACWKQETGDSLFEPQVPLSKFTIRQYDDYLYEGCPFVFDKSLIKRINGELTTFNTIEIIKRYKPKYYIIENPAYGRIWDYIESVIGFDLTYDNFTYYGNYGTEYKKATKFASNVDLKLDDEKPSEMTNMKYIKWEGSRYNARSNIPEPLVKQIFEQILGVTTCDM